MIESITLENWKTHKASTLHFRKGTNVLVGVIGSGKSSVMDGLCYGLFGTFPAVQNRRVSVSDLLMRKPYSADQARIEVCFRVGEKKYKVERILKRDGINEGRLWMNETLIAGPKPNQVTERVEKELNVTYELFTRAVYSEQNQVDYFLKLNPGDRKKKFDELLELQKYEGVRANAMQVVNQFRKQEEQHAQSLAQFDAVLQNQDLNELRLNVSLQNQKLSSITNQKELLGQTLEQAKARAQELESALGKATILKEKIQRMDAQREALFKQAESIRTLYPAEVSRSPSEIEAEKKEWEQKRVSLVARQEQFRAAEAAFQKAAERVRGLDSRLRDIESMLQARTPEAIEQEYVRLQESLDRSRKAYELCQRELAAAMANVRVAEQKILVFGQEEKDLSALHASCPTCKQSISTEHKEQMRLEMDRKKKLIEDEKNLAQHTMKQHDAQRQTLEKEYAALEDASRKLVLAREKAKEHVLVQNECIKAKESLVHAQTTVSALGSGNSFQEMEQLQAKLTGLNKVVEFHTFSAQEKVLVNDGAKLKLELSAIGVTQDQVMQAVQARSECQSAILSLEREFALEQKILNEIQSRVKSVEQVQAQQYSLKEKRDRALDVQQSMSLFANVLIETQQQLRETVVEAINAALGELWPWVYPYKDFTLAKVLVQDNDYVLTVQERNGNWVSAESSLSGGERSAAALALRMSIGFVLTRQLSWVILDEPTHNLDQKSIATLSEVLRTRLPELVDQVFVITHAQEIEKSATGSLYLLQREKNEDGVTIPINKLDLGMKLES